MTPIRPVVFALTLGLALPPAAAELRAQVGQPLPLPVVALTDAAVVDVTTGQVTTGVTVVVRDGRIASVSPAPPPAGAEVIDLGGRFVVPGLIDAHAHVDDLAAADRALATGVTTLRSASVGSYRDVALRELFRGGYRVGPDVAATGVFVTPRIGGALLADTALLGLGGDIRSEEALRLLVRVNVRNGVDFIKTRGTERAGLPDTDPRQQVYTEDQLRVIVDEASRGGVPVMAHAHGDEGAAAAVRAGVRSIEHGTYLSDATIALMRDRGTFLVPTFSTVVDLVEPGGDYDDPVLRARGMHMLPRLAQTVRAAHRAGVRIVAGADIGYGPASITRVSHEVANFVDLGMTPLEALQTATLNAAALLGLSDDVGRIAPGYQADLIVVEGNPLADPVALQDVLVVISNGRIGINRLPFGREGRGIS